MKYLALFIASIGLSSAQVPAPDYFRFMQWDAATNLQNRTVAVPASPGQGFFIFHPTSRRPYCAPSGDVFYDPATDSVKVNSSLFTPYATTASLAGYVATSDFTWSNLGGKPTLFSGAYADLTGKPALFDGQYTSLTGIPSTFVPSAHTHSQSDVTGLVAALSAKEPSISTGTTAQYWRGDKSWVNFPTIPTNTNQLTNGAGFLTSEVDGSITNEIELPSQTGQIGKILGTNGTSAVWQAAATGTVTSITAGTGLSGGTITTTGTISLPNTGTAGTYSGVTTDSQGRVTAGTTLAFSSSARTLNTAFQIDASRSSFVSYTVDVASTLSLTGGQTGTCTLQYADDSGFTTNVVTVQSSVNGNTGTLTIGLALTQTSTAALTGMVPAGKYVRIATANTAGTPTFTFRSAQEVKL